MQNGQNRHKDDSPPCFYRSNSRDARGSKRSSLKLPKTPLSAREETISSRGATKKKKKTRERKNEADSFFFLRKGGPPPPPVDRDRYPNWCVADAPVDAAQVAAIFQFFEYHYGFQHDNVCNIFDYLLTLLDSRAARMAPTQALRTLHADYIGGEHANYRTWYFAAQLDLDLRHTRPASANSDPTASDAARKRRKKKTNATDQLLAQANQEWQAMMVALSDVQRLEQLALFLLIWGEASTLRYMPELLCFIFRLANDRRATLDARSVRGAQPNAFLDTVVTPLYAFARDQSYLLVHGQHIRREKDHNSIIGYDDMNQLFWDRRAIAKLMLKGQSGVILKDIPVEHRYDALPMIDWESAFGKLFYETRSWLHLFTNFARFWVLHMSTFWYYMTANMDFFYIADARRRSPPLPLKLSIVALGGLVAIVLIMLATIAEFKYLPTRSHVTKILAWRLLILALLGAMHVGATFYIVYLDNQSLVALILASCQLGLGAIVTLILAIVPSARLFRFGRSHRHLATQAFTAHFPCLQGDDRFLSVLLWLCVFACKFLETYFFQALSFSEAVETMVTARLTGCRSDPLVKDWLCDVMPWMATILMFMVELLLFFLDTYLWYIIWNTVFSVSQAMRLGISIMTSWRTMFARLPHHMHQKITTATDPLKKMACSQLWNAIIISMYREHLLSINNLQWLMYKVYNKTSASEEDQLDQVSTTSTQHGRTQGTQNMRGLSVPAIFDLRNTQIKKDQCFPAYSEAERRLSFFAQSLASDMPKPYSVPDMPTFTVFTPHYAEKMLLSLREIIREEDSTTRVTLLEYLKRLHHAEWLHFVKDTKVLAEEDEEEEEEQGNFTAIKDKDDLPFYCIGFKSSAPEYTLRTRVWASLRAQTLYRTISGFMNYARALKILHRVEHPELSNIDQPQATEAQLDRLAYHKFRFLVAMQRYSRFTDEENDNCEYLLSEFPHLEIAYIEEEKNASRTEGATFYSCLVDGTCEKLPNGRRKPKCRIRLPGNPILGDGKSDNQNHAIIFARGEYLQLVDANQDNYLEEALKIRSIFREFETTGQNSTLRAEFSMYALSDPRTATPPVAIVGAREYIFSENIGVLGDIAAGKEQTFGTLTQRIMAKAGGRLHYGHPDFLNAVFMTSRGGVSKAQRGLHLNEDIFAGIMAFTRGGRIKHSEYLQCGKGRDLGFCSILNFTTKIGTGMGEQLLSREYYYLGTQLPLDRFLTFYYAHPGFHMNNVMIIFAIQLFLFCMTVVGTIAMAFPPSTCMFSLTQVVTCLDMMPVYDWLRRSILSIFMVFFISFLPLFLQELTEKGTARSVMRLVKQFVSLSPLFEVFVTQIYANAVLSNLSFGGARYIATGRGFATSRLPFVQLYARFANSSIYFGARNMFMLLLVSLLVWFPHLIYFWATVSSLVISPFIFNPHQFVLSEFILDYRRFLYWFIQEILMPLRFIFKTFVAVFITRELPHDDCNRAWWNGHWEKLGRHAMREYMVKIMEMSVFTNDFVLGHAILFFLFPVTWIPFIDRLHSIILFWLRPSKQIRPSILSTRQQQKRTRMVLAYTPLFVLMFLLFASCFLLPILFLKPLTQAYSLPFDRYF
ncbi:1,3-beta-glucan synthase component-domain-containing protein [Gongronella butleri]|nr:1,3-beta-glucan synthase component-domain-containing protein [Gongronella butleri]